MKISDCFFFKFHNALTILSVLLLSVPAASQVEISTVKLSYNYPVDSPVKYISNNKIVQDMDINGQSMLVNVVSILGCTIRSTGIVDNNLALEVTIDTLVQNTESPQGSFGGAVTDVTGKPFMMKITTEGKETDLSGAELITYRTGNGSTNTAAESFDDFFPDLPSKEMSPGFTWTSTDTLTTKTSERTLTMIVISENKFEGFEQFNGFNCAKTVYTLTGTMDLKTQTQGMDIKIAGPLTGSGELYFAPAEGYFIKHTSKNRISGLIEITAPESMSFPVIMNINSVKEVVK